ncbi:Cache 3/Cache 2 fusion domain-containing protein [Methanococcoides methylutens]|uniref:Methyl-accepting chemotaxis protein n=1 Tax=Methanococcoides methylutens MM1 TaxID=1434104 RepID=A0A0E3SRA4_METMT|nr:cache domain-containing protein [Methanococcoides methylutens]AKB85401.1 Methyl-accepting chemotaxis protein [Methanococcoides methylutens MM1]
MHNQSDIHHKKMISAISLIILIASFVLVINFGYDLVYGTDQILESSIDSAQLEAQNSAEQISSTLIVLSDISQSIAAELSSGELKEEHIEDRLFEDINSNPEIFGVGVAYKKGAYKKYDESSQNDLLYAPTYSRKNGDPQLFQASYDYTVRYNESDNGPNTEWYHRALIEGGGFNDPYFGSRSNKYIIEYSIPFTTAYADQKELSPAGVVYASYSLEGVRNNIASLESGNTGYGFIVSKDGNVISHPIKNYVGKSVDEISGTDEVFKELTSSISHDTINTVYEAQSGNKLWVFYEEIPGTEWILGVVLKDEEISNQMSQEQYNKKIYLSLAMAVFLASISIIGFTRNGITSRSLWKIAIIISVLCLIEMGFIWNLAMTKPISENMDDIIIYDESGLESSLEKIYVSEMGDLNNEYVDSVIKVPTGIFVQSIEFSTGNDVIITGYVWQKHIEGVNDDHVHGVIFPESESTSIDKAYETEDVTGWYFTTTLREQFDYMTYPFDVENVWIKLWSDSFENNVILVPDLESYESLDPESNPGLEKDLVLEGWEAKESYFSYRVNDYDSNFGIDGYNHQGNPDLYFNMELKRDVITPFITYMIPLLLIALLIFIALFTEVKVDTDPSEILKYSASLMLILMVAHVSLRDSLTASGIIYIEYFYIIMYLVVLGISLNALLFASDKKIPIIDYENNIIAKIIYWPVIMTLVLMVTIKTFY